MAVGFSESERVSVRESLGVSERDSTSVSEPDGEKDSLQETVLLNDT